MNTVMITRHSSGCWNVEDTFSVGNFEFEGRSSMTEYQLPVGYTVDGDRIYDSADIECAICPDGNMVTLISRAGLCADVILKECA